MGKRTPPPLPPQYQGPAPAFPVYAPLWVWAAWDRQRKAHGLTVPAFLDLTLNDKFGHRRWKIEATPDIVALDRQWRIITVSAAMSHEIRLQAQTYRQDPGEMIGSALRARAMPTLAKQFRLWET